jgi:hypothetical protein
MDSSPAAQFELLVALAKGISYKNGGRCVLKANAQASEKKPYEKPVLRVYGDIRTMTQAHVAGKGNKDGIVFARMNLKTG